MLILPHLLAASSQGSVSLSIYLQGLSRAIVRRTGDRKWSGRGGVQEYDWAEVEADGARWNVDRLNEMAVLCSVHYFDLWKKYGMQAM